MIGEELQKVYSLFTFYNVSNENHVTAESDAKYSKWKSTEAIYIHNENIPH